MVTEKGGPFTYNGFQNYVRRIGDRFQAAGVEHTAVATTGRRTTTATG